jgi:hypothetical protein
MTHSIGPAEGPRAGCSFIPYYRRPIGNSKQERFCRRAGVRQEYSGGFSPSPKAKSGRPSAVRADGLPLSRAADTQTAFLPAPVQFTKRQAGPRPRAAFSGAPVQNTKLCVYGDLTVSYPPDRPQRPHFQGRQPRSPDRQRPPGGRLAVWSLVIRIFGPKTPLPVPAPVPFAAPNVSIATVFRSHTEGGVLRIANREIGGPGERGFPPFHIRRNESTITPPLGVTNEHVRTSVHGGMVGAR